MRGEIDVMAACDYNFPTLQEARRQFSIVSTFHSACCRRALWLMWADRWDLWRTPRLGSSTPENTKVWRRLLRYILTPPNLKVLPWWAFLGPFWPWESWTVSRRESDVKENAFLNALRIKISIRFWFFHLIIWRIESESCWRQRICWCVCGTPLWPGPASLEPLQTFYTNYSQLARNPF